jgi:integrase
MGQHGKVTMSEVNLAHHPAYKWAVYWPASEPGKPKRTKRFKTKDAASRFRTEKENELLRDGRKSANLRESAVREALWAVKALEPCGVTLRQVVEEYLAHHEAGKRSKAFNVAVEEFLETKKAAGKSLRYRADLQFRLRAFNKAGGGEDKKPFGERLVSEITARDVEAWLAGLAGSPVTRNNFRRVLGVFFTWARKMDLCGGNPAIDATAATEIPERVEVFTPAELRLILDQAPAELLPQFVLGAFAGLRTAEIDRLRWDKVNFTKERIEVDAKIAKGAAHRFVPIPPVLAAWLKPIRKESGLVQASRAKMKLREFRRELAIPSPERPAVTWKHNGLRHSFGSYALAREEDAGKVAAWMGHTNPHMLFRHYRERVEREEADEWFKVFPSVFK